MPSINILRYIGPFEDCRFIVFTFLGARRMTLQVFDSIDTKELCCSPNVSVFKLPPGHTAIVEVNESRPDGRFLFSVKQLPPSTIDEKQKTSLEVNEEEVGMCSGDCDPYLIEDCRTDIERAVCNEEELECVEDEPPKQD